MTIKFLTFSRFAAVFIAVVMVLGDVNIASAQSTRYLKRDVAAGKQIEFQWTNYNGATCRDNGYVDFKVVRKPRLGKFRTVRKRITQRNGACKGKRFRTVFIYYVAGRKKGADTAAFAIQGANRVEINLNVNVR